MGWKERLLPASYKGVPFKVESYSHEGGRNVVVHEFAKRKVPYSEDTGSAAKGDSIEAYVLGDDYMEQRDALMFVLNEEGPGELIHPYLGSLQVQPGKFTLSESKKEGGFAKFSLLFTEAGAILYPSSIDNAQVDVQSAAASTLENSKAEFDQAYSVIGAPGFVAESARSNVSKAADLFKNKTKLIAATSNAAAEFSFSIGNLQNELTDLANSPSKLSERLQGSIGLIAALTDDNDQKNTVFKDLSSYSNEVVTPFETSARAQEVENNKQINNLIIRTSLAYEAENLSEQSFDTEDEAQEALDLIGEKIRLQMESTGSDDLYQSLSDLIASLTNALQDQSRNFKNLITFEAEEYQPTLIHCYEKLGSIDAEEDFIQRNNVSHPAFVPPGRLEVASD